VAIDSPFRKELFQRDWQVIVSREGRPMGLDVTELDMEWEVEKSLKPEPNKCSLKIYNLSADHRHLLESVNIYDPKKSKSSTAGSKATKTTKSIKTGNLRVEILAGYKETGKHLIFRGDLRRALSSVDGDKTWTTSIEGEDGGRSVLSSRISESFPKGTPLRVAVEKCADALGLGTGNILQVEGTLARTTFTHGTVLDGSASKELAGIIRRAGLRYSIQDGALLFLDVGKGRTRAAVKLDYASGLVMAPERDTAGLVIATSLLNPDLVVGNYVFLSSKDVLGTFLIEKVTYTCSTLGDDWYVRLELRAA
jgi:hypothetical protein